MSVLALEARGGGSGNTLLLLLHGLGGNGTIWAPLVEHIADWQGRWLAPDLRGHGRSPHASDYSLEAQASDLAALIAGETDVVVLGHSMGGAVGITLAQLAPEQIRRVAVFGVKECWDPALVEKFHALAALDRKQFGTRDEAASRYLASAGIKGLVAPDDPVALSGIEAGAQAGTWQLAADPGTYRVAGVQIAATARTLEIPLLVTGGAKDPIVSLEEMKLLCPQARPIDGAGHNPHVEAPGALWKVVGPFLAGNNI